MLSYIAIQYRRYRVHVHVQRIAPGEALWFCSTDLSSYNLSHMEIRLYDSEHGRNNEKMTTPGCVITPQYRNTRKYKADLI